MFDQNHCYCNFIYNHLLDAHYMVYSIVYIMYTICVIYYILVYFILYIYNFSHEIITQSKNNSYYYFFL